MLKFADCNDANDIKAFLGNGIIPLRICSYMTAYGFDKDFVKFFIQYNEEGIQGVISFFEDSALVEATEKADFGEILSFLSMNYFSTLSCRKEVADLLGISQSYISRLEKKIMKRLKKEIAKYE